MRLHALSNEPREPLVLSGGRWKLWPLTSGEASDISGFCAPIEQDFLTEMRLMRHCTAVSRHYQPLISMALRSEIGPLPLICDGEKSTFRYLFVVDHVDHAGRAPGQGRGSSQARGKGRDRGPFQREGKAHRGTTDPPLLLKYHDWRGGLEFQLYEIQAERRKCFEAFRKGPLSAEEERALRFDFTNYLLKAGQALAQTWTTAFVHSQSVDRVIYGHDGTRPFTFETDDYDKFWDKFLKMRKLLEPDVKKGAFDLLERITGRRAAPE